MLLNNANPNDQASAIAMKAGVHCRYVEVDDATTVAAFEVTKGRTESTCRNPIWSLLRHHRTLPSAHNVFLPFQDVGPYSMDCQGQR